MVFNGQKSIRKVVKSLNNIDVLRKTTVRNCSASVRQWEWPSYVSVYNSGYKQQMAVGK